MPAPASDLRIFKYPLSICDRQRTIIPAGSIILDFQVQDGKICMWCLVDSSRHPQARTFFMFGTGESIDSELYRQIKHQATVQLDGYVWHIFMYDLDYDYD